MTATAQNVTHYQGDSRKLIFGPVRDTNGNLVDLTSALSVRWWMAKKVNSTGDDIYIQKALGSGIALVEDDGEWTIEVTLVPADTEDLAPGSWYHECEVVDAASRVATVMVGKFTLKDTVIDNA